MKRYDGYALITGGSSGIGLEFARQLAGMGYNIVLVARNQERLDRAANQIKQDFNVDVVTIAQDLCRKESTDSIVNELQKRKIHVGFLINNAGFGKWDPFHKLSRQIMRDMIKVHCVSPTDLTYRLLPGMLEKGNGAVIFVSSLAGLAPASYYNAVYGSAKDYLVKLGLSLHAEYEKKGVDILTTCPGFVDTPIFESTGDVRPNVSFMTTEEVVKRSLNALGKEIILRFFNNRLEPFLLLLSSFMSEKMVEKIAIKYTKDEIIKKMDREF